MKRFVPYNFSTKKFASEWTSGGSSGIDWTDSPTGCIPVHECELDWFRENYPDKHISQMIPSLKLACSPKAREEIRKCGVVEVELDWKFVEESA